MSIAITQFTIDWYDSVFALWQRCEGVGLSDADSRECIRSYLDRNPGMSFVAVAGGKVAGAVLAGHDGRRGYLHHLAVHTDFRRQGVGLKLVERCLSVLSDAGIRKCHVFIFNGNTDGASFWQSIGWTRRKDIGVTSIVIEQQLCGEERQIR